MKCLAAILSLLTAQEDKAFLEGAARQAAMEVRRQAAGTLGELEGILSISYAGTGTDYRLLISVFDANAKREARQALGGDEYKGLKIHWVVPNNTPAVKLPKADTTTAKKQVSTPEFPEDRDNVWKAAVTDCDIIADHVNVKRTAIKKRDAWGRTSLPCRVIRRSVVGTGGGHTYVYTNHRNDCPVRLGRVDEPWWSDNFTAWVFQKGFTPVARGGFTWPFELRGSDNLWTAQAKGDLMTRLPHIREGAEWTNTWTDSRAGKTGSYSPGTGWTWSQPWTGGNPYGGPAPTPTGSGCAN